jgi:hypothetical protein
LKPAQAGAEPGEIEREGAVFSGQSGHFEDDFNTVSHRGSERYPVAGEML